MKRGTGRIVILCGPLAIKFCRIDPLLNIVREIWEGLTKKEWNIRWASIGLRWRYFLKGIRQNRTEHHCWRITHAPFLVPTLIGLGIVNVQMREYGEMPKSSELNQVFLAMGGQPAAFVHCIDPHCLSPKNFLKNTRGYRIVDYGDGSEADLTFPKFIIRWQNELKAVLCR